MYKLSLIIIYCTVTMYAQVPHGDDFNLDCDICHTSEGWQINPKNISFDHSETEFELLGQHKSVSCGNCHKSLVFNQAADQCFECHADIHENTLGKECGVCHNFNSWIVTDIKEIHDLNRFPLLGSHAVADCEDCHASISNLRFEPLGIRCYDCHNEQYLVAQNPNHIASGFSTDCEECHSIDAVDWALAGFAHDFFPLSGGHNIDNCYECHLQDTFEGLSSSCYDCHQSDYENAQSVDHIAGGFETTCENCHSLNPGWSPAFFPSHDAEYFPIFSGEHAGAWNDCSDCHTTPNNFTMFSCIDCHEHNQPEMNEKHQGVSGYAYESNSCYACHPNGSEEGGINHNLTNFPLTGSHTAVDCQDCHVTVYQGTSTLCDDCHHEEYLNAPEHTSSGFPITCEECHNTSTWEEAIFDHNSTNFPLTGSHTTVVCQDCHVSGYQGTSTLCDDCHHEEYLNAPEHVSSGFPLTCEQCHSTTNWEEATFDHNNTNFPLTGGHIGQSCETCHSTGYQGTSTICFDCHAEDFNATANPNHQKLGLASTCEDCHTTNPGWSPASFPVHDDFYLLQGAHLTVPNCMDCHTVDYNNTPNQCIGCHQSDYDATTDPAHASAGFSTDCETCHTETAWEPANFDHDGQYFPINSGEHNGEWNACSDCHNVQSNFAAFTCIDCHEHNQTDMDDEHQGVNGYVYISEECFACHPDGSSEGAFNHANSNFPLTGAHTTLLCEDCHSTGYFGTSNHCYDCHTDVYNSSQNPSHQSMVLSQVCEECHTTDGWTPSTFSHTSTGFELIGGHQITDCSTCHTTDVSTTTNLCYDCHQEEYSTAPEHSSLGFPTECEQCHSVNNWTETSFDHNNTNFPLTGAHQTQNCEACHIEGYAGTSSLCFDCHTDDYNSSQNPSHQTLVLSQSCEECHMTDAWTPSTFNHASTGFELIGGHLITNCSSCHTTDVSTTTNVCYDCHQDDYSSAPEHSTLGYPTDCEQCHSVNNWQETSFDHNNTNFPLTGAHIDQSCSDCHSSGFEGTSTICSDCHTEDFNSSTNPNHQNLGLSNVCDNCHTTEPGWSPAAFPNHNDFYELIGAHASISNNCVDCHSGDYNTTPNTCYQCHQSDYEGTTDPSHSNAQFPTDCESCHTQTAWEPSTFDHDGLYFPIYSGEHNGEWNACIDCHTVPTNYSQFSCIDCHEHNQTDMDSEHDDVSGYIYESTACYDCHPEGTEGDISLPHLNDEEF